MWCLRLGNIKQIYVVRIAEELMEVYPTEFSADFEVNKKKVNEHCSVTSKGVRNKIAGYISQQMRPAKKEEEKTTAA